MKYVEFGAQENRDFDYEKYVIGERIQDYLPFKPFLLKILRRILSK